MSYTLEIWSVAPVPLPDGLPQRAAWQPQHDCWTHNGAGWQVVVGSSDRVLPEDVPDDVNECLPGIAYLTELNLSPIDAASSRRRLLMRTATTLAKLGHGVVFDPQLDTVTTPRGLKRFVSPGPSEEASLLTLSWWSARGDLVDRADASALLNVLAAALPEALPRRYGLYEPPQHLYTETGRTHFEEFLRGSLHDTVVWYAHAPVAHVGLSIPERIGGSPLGFRAARVTIEVDAEALHQPGWQAGLQTVWTRLSKVLRPFYGDVRTLRGFTRSRGRYWTGPATEHHPVCAWWWAGVPHGPAHAIVIGEPYQSLWPTLHDLGAVENGLWFLSTGNWISADDIYARCGPPPGDIAQLAPEYNGPNHDRLYPRTWPFSAPREGV